MGMIETSEGPLTPFAQAAGPWILCEPSNLTCVPLSVISMDYPSIPKWDTSDGPLRSHHLACVVVVVAEAMVPLYVALVALVILVTWSTRHNLFTETPASRPDKAFYVYAALFV